MTTGLLGECEQMVDEKIENVKEEFDKKMESMKMQLLKQIHDSQNFKFKKVDKKKLLKKAVPVKAPRTASNAAKVEVNRGGASSSSGSA